MIQLVVFATVAIHFTKRVLETLFLHKYSGPIGIFTTFMIAGFYSLCAYLIGYLNRQPVPSADIWFYIGVVLFIVGILGNFIHHKILADLRKNTLDYIIPSSGLFNFIVCPHYLFEIVSWLGIFLVSRHLASLLVIIFIIGYLTARSIRTLKWYQEKFSEFPAARKAILPFIL
jgi:very-long-chain enoyl-CoA reductase